MDKQVAFDRWTQGRSVASLGTNAGSEILPFQSWRNFKEAFAPELIARAVAESDRRVKACIDPFGGSGTTALACQFLGVEPITIEVNPYLADLIQAKLASYDGGALAQDLGKIVRSIKRWAATENFSHTPPTFVEPGVNGRWIFDRDIALRIAAYRAAINGLANEAHRIFFRALLGGIIGEASNVVISGKGRRYRRGWQTRARSPEILDKLFLEHVTSALSEIVRYSFRPTRKYTLLRGDCREMIQKAGRADLAVFSPPYPNSFDYTDVYNIELWMLGYLADANANRKLRLSTLTSHVQILRDYSKKPKGSRSLNRVSKELHASKELLWSPWIPSMVDGYFADMSAVLRSLSNKLYSHGQIWAVVGDSRYANIHIPSAQILTELAREIGLEPITKEAFRSMRSSAQQGGREELHESLIVFRKP